MKYKDHKDAESGEMFVNGTYVGVRYGSSLSDALAPNDDGYGHLRSVNRFGSMLQDATADKNVPSGE